MGVRVIDEQALGDSCGVELLISRDQFDVTQTSGLPPAV
jgi:hypothetical protein